MQTDEGYPLAAGGTSTLVVSPAELMFEVGQSAILAQEEVSALP